MQVKGWNWTCRSQSLPGSPDRGAVLRVQDRGTGLRSLARRTAHRRVLPRSHRDLRRIHTNTQLRKKIKVLSLSSNRKQLRYGDRSNIFGWFPNGTAKTILEMA